MNRQKKARRLLLFCGLVFVFCMLLGGTAFAAEGEAATAGGDWGFASGMAYIGAGISTGVAAIGGGIAVGDRIALYCADASQGVIDAQGRVFGYANAYVCDGSMISANPGVNPSLSITAISEYVMAQVPPKNELNVR